MTAAIAATPRAHRDMASRKYPAPRSANLEVDLHPPLRVAGEVAVEMPGAGGEVERLGGDGAAALGVEAERGAGAVGALEHEAVGVLGGAQVELHADLAG